MRPALLARRPGLVATGAVVAVTALACALWQPALAQAPATSATSTSTSTSAAPSTTTSTASTLPPAPPGIGYPDDYVAIGESLFNVNCVSCHGTGGVGTASAPTLIGVGEAAADFQLQTGRMPLADPQGQAPSKPPAFSDQEIQALVAYVGSLGEGTPIPNVDVDAGDLVEGGELFRANCAACHGAAAVGGALSYGRYAPSLHDVGTVQIAEAVRVGPGQMPVFDDDVFDEHELNSIVRYVEYLQDPADPGGFSLGRIGPVAEGYVAWVVGIGAVLVFVRWITRRRRSEAAAHG